MAEAPELESDSEPEGALGSISPAAAMAIGIRKGLAGKKPDPEFDAFLREQTDLARIQKEHLHEQRALTLSHMRWRRFSDQIKVLLQIMTAAAGLAVAGGLVWMAWSASQERGLVIEPFSVPPELAARGITGQVIASKMQDRLSAMQNATTSARAASTFANNWNDDIKVEIPETGVSVGELHRLMVSWLGHQTRISGELYRTASGVELSARVGAAPAKVCSGGEADLNAMIAQTAEDIYAQSQPYRFGVWVASALDPQALERARRVFLALGSTGDRTDRIWALNGLGIIYREQGDISGAIRTFAAGLEFEPRYAGFHSNLAQAHRDLGQDEAALAEQRATVALAERYPRLFMTPRDAMIYQAAWRARVDSDLGDFAAAAHELAAIQSLPNSPLNSRLFFAQSLASGHDLGAAEASAALVETASADDLSPVAADHRRVIGEAVAAIALAREDWPGVRAAVAGINQSKLTPERRLQLQALQTPRLALAMAKLGDVQGAEALIATTARDCYDCVLMRGRIAAIAGDWPGAERWFAEAARRGPSLPFAYAEWGRALLDRADAAGAIAKLQIAHQKGPHFADPLETWGEALMAQRDWAGAAGKFAEADQDAPKWGRNHLRWGEALMMSGQYRQARAQFEAASGLDLSSPDRAALDVLMGRTAKGPLHG